MKNLLRLLLLLFIIASCSKPGNETYIVTHPIRSLQFERLGTIQGSGHFFLGCGNVSIGEEIKEYYYFYDLTDKGYQLKRSPRETTYLLECDTLEPCVRRIFTGKKLKRNDGSGAFQVWNGLFFEWMSLETIVTTDWEKYDYVFDGNRNYIQLIIPEGTIINYYNTYE